jgi:hypothetical protein
MRYDDNFDGTTQSSVDDFYPASGALDLNSTTNSFSATNNNSTGGFSNNTGEFNNNTGSFSNNTGGFSNNGGFSNTLFKASSYDNNGTSSFTDNSDVRRHLERNTTTTNMGFNYNPDDTSIGFMNETTPYDVSSSNLDTDYDSISGGTSSRLNNQYDDDSSFGYGKSNNEYLQGSGIADNYDNSGNPLNRNNNNQNGQGSTLKIKKVGLIIAVFIFAIVIVLIAASSLLNGSVGSTQSNTNTDTTVVEDTAKSYAPSTSTVKDNNSYVNLGDATTSDSSSTSTEGSLEIVEGTVKFSDPYTVTGLVVDRYLVEVVGENTYIPVVKLTMSANGETITLNYYCNASTYSAVESGQAVTITYCLDSYGKIVVQSLSLTK